MRSLLIKDKKIYRTMLSMALPIMIEEGLQTLVQYVDTAMVGSISAEASAAVGLSQTPTWLIWGLLRAASIGLISYISQSVGAGDPEKPRRAGGQGILYSLVIGTVVMAIACGVAYKMPVWMGVEEDIQFMAGQYFFILSLPMIFRSLTINLGAVIRSTGNMRTPMLVNVVVNAINIVLNFFLIFPTRTVSIFGSDMTIYGADMGVKGAAIASSIGITVGGILMLLAVFRNQVVSPVGYGIRPDRDITRYCVKIAIPAGVQHIIVTMGFVVFAGLVASSLGTVAFAAHSIANTAETAFYIPAYGLQGVAATMIGMAIGERDEKKMDAVAQMLFTIAILVMGFLGILLFAFSPQLMRIFTKDAEVIAMGAVVLRIVAVAEPLFGGFTVFEGILRGAGNLKPTVAIALGCMWGIRILFTWLCLKVFSLGLVAVWICMSADNVGRFLCYTFLYKSDRWKRTIPFIRENAA